MADRFNSYILPPDAAKTERPEMPLPITQYRVFIASPSGLTSVRQAFRATLDDYNRTDARRRGVIFQAVGWEDTVNGSNRPQSLINPELEACDHVVFLFRERWGSSPGVNSPYSSGCEEEWVLANKLLHSGSILSVHLFFITPSAEQLSNPDSQLARVLEFREQIVASKAHLFKDLQREDEFPAELRVLLGSWMHNHEKKQHAIEAGSHGVGEEGSLPIGRKVVRLRKGSWASALLTLEGICVGILTSVVLNEAYPNLHGALATTIGIATGVTFLVLVLSFPLMFWIWTLFFAGTAAYSILRDVEDRGWAIFWASAAVLLTIVLHLYSRDRMRACDEEIVVEE